MNIIHRTRLAAVAIMLVCPVLAQSPLHAKTTRNVAELGKSGVLPPIATKNEPQAPPVKMQKKCKPKQPCPDTGIAKP